MHHLAGASSYIESNGQKAQRWGTDKSTNRCNWGCTEKVSSGAVRRTQIWIHKHIEDSGTGRSRWRTMETRLREAWRKLAAHKQKWRREQTTGGGKSPAESARPHLHRIWQKKKWHFRYCARGSGQKPFQNLPGKGRESGSSVQGYVYTISGVYGPNSKREGKQEVQVRPTVTTLRPGYY